MPPTLPDHLVTCALTYANGPMHCGHLVEFIQADIFVRSKRMSGDSCLFICGNDAHGTPILLAAEKQGITPEALIADIHQQHTQSLKNFHIGLDDFYLTHSDENKKRVNELYEKLKAENTIQSQEVKQAFDTERQMFLPDRYVKGTCPRCHAKDQYGDACESCGATYNTNELIDAVSTLSQTPPDYRLTTHLFFDLPRYGSAIKEWMQQANLQPQIVNKLQEWFDAGLKEWCISRDAPYFGFAIPDQPDKYFYVWLDAPVGYISILDHYCQTQKPGYNSDDIWQPNSPTKIHHFIGKDIMYFHALFWPALLMAAKLRLPSHVHTHGFLTIDGKKMSKSRGTFITADHFLSQLPADTLRYYLAAKLSAQVEDIDLNLEDFMQRVNADLVGKYVNIASRCARFINRDFDGMLSDSLANPTLYQMCVDAGGSIEKHYHEKRTSHAIREIMTLADHINQYIDEQKPWTLAKQDPHNPDVQRICSQGIQLFRLLSLYLKPVIPYLVSQAEIFLNDSLDHFKQTAPLLSHRINDFKPLLQRITREQIDALTHDVN